jgi:PBSX family phage portal protein
MTGYLLDSATGQICKMNSATMLEGAIAPAEYQQILKAITDPTRGSRKLRQKFGVVIDGVTCAPRPFDVGLYAYAVTLNTYHSRATRAKAKDIAGRGWSIGGDGSEAQRKIVTDFFTRAFVKDTFSRGMGRVWSDYESLGNGFLEVIPTIKGNQPAQLEHIPATQVWVRLDGKGFVQQLGSDCTHFRDYMADAKVYQSLPETDPLAASKDATAILHFSNYTSWSPYYGVPSIMPAWPALAMMTLISEYNLRFFSNNAIPDYVVTVEGDADDETVALIREYFRTHIQGQSHKTLILQAPSGQKVTFQELQKGNKEGAFRMMRSDCRDEILHAHGVPPQKVGIVETGKLGGNLASEQIAEYKASIVSPGQEDLSAGMNVIIQRGFEFEGLTFECAPFDIDDRKLNADIDAIYLDRNVRVPNEVRRERFPDALPLEGGDEPLKSATLSDLAGIDQAMQEVQQTVREAVKR